MVLPVCLLIMLIFLYLSILLMQDLHSLFKYLPNICESKVLLRGIGEEKNFKILEITSLKVTSFETTCESLKCRSHESDVFFRYGLSPVFPRITASNEAPFRPAESLDQIFHLIPNLFGSTFD